MVSAKKRLGAAYEGSAEQAELNARWGKVNALKATKTAAQGRNPQRGQTAAKPPQLKFSEEPGPDVPF